MRTSTPRFAAAQSASVNAGRGTKYAAVSSIASRAEEIARW